MNNFKFNKLEYIISSVEKENSQKIILKNLIQKLTSQLFFTLLGRRENLRCAFDSCKFFTSNNQFSLYR